MRLERLSKVLSCENAHLSFYSYFTLKTFKQSMSDNAVVSVEIIQNSEVRKKGCREVKDKLTVG